MAWVTAKPGLVRFLLHALDLIGLKANTGGQLACYFLVTWAGHQSHFLSMITALSKGSVIPYLQRSRQEQKEKE